MNEIQRIAKVREDRSRRLQELAKKDAKIEEGTKFSIKDEEQTISDAYMH